jgi:hypothetical protein
MLRLTHIYFGKEKADGKSLLKAADHELETLWVKGHQIVPCITRYLLLLIIMAIICVISDFRDGTNEIFVLLGWQAVKISGSAPTFRESLSVPPSKVKQSALLLKTET